MFVTFEGIDGSGKSTLLRAISQRCRQLGREVCETREPGSGPLGPPIRKLLLKSGDVHPVAELLLFLADRAAHVASIVRPALERGCIVLCDRYTLSTLAYQGYGRGLDLALLNRLNGLATGDLAPDVTFVLDLPPSLARQRLETADRIDAESPEFFERVRTGFIAEAAEMPTAFVLDACAPPQEVDANCWARLEPMLRRAV